MESENYYVKNEETGKLNIFTSKVFYGGLSFQERGIFKKLCLWSRTQNCWISKAKADNCWHLKSKLNEMGFEDRGIVGERLPFVDQVKREQERAETRAERAEKRAENAEKVSDALYKRATEMSSAIPFGQPILVGHHSEKRDRNYRQRIHNTFGKAFEEQEKADYYKQRAENAKWTADGEKYKNPRYLSNRIKESQAAIRRLERSLKGKLYVHSPEKEISEESREFYNKRLKEEQEKLDFYLGCMKEINPEYQVKKSRSKAENKGKGLK